MSEAHTFAELEGRIDELTNLTVKMFGRKFTLNPMEDLKFQMSTLGQAIQEQPSKFAFYASLRDMANTKVEAFQSKIDGKRSELDQQYRREGYLPGGVKITEDSMNRFLRAHPEVVDLQGKARDARHEAALLGSIVRAFEQRRDMLIQANNRAANTMFNDQDVKTVTIHASIKNLVAANSGKGQFPGK